MQNITLAQILDLPPLTKVQVNSKETIREASLDPRSVDPIPWWFVQGQENGQLLLMSPGGYKHAVSPHDICDVLPSEPIIVMAMPQKTFLERLGLSPLERNATHGPHLFEPAHVKNVTKTKWGKLDQVHVQFIDPRHHEGSKTSPSPVDDASRELLNKIANRNVMPVSKSGDSSANFSALKERPEVGAARRRISAFIKDRVHGGQSMPTDIERRRMSQR